MFSGQASSSRQGQRKVAKRSLGDSRSGSSRRWLSSPARGSRVIKPVAYLRCEVCGRLGWAARQLPGYEEYAQVCRVCDEGRRFSRFQYRCEVRVDEEGQVFKVPRSGSTHFVWEGVRGLRQLGSGFCYATQAKDRGLLCLEEKLEAPVEQVTLASLAFSEGGQSVISSDMPMVVGQHIEASCSQADSTLCLWPSEDGKDLFDREFGSLFADISDTEGRGFLRSLAGQSVRSCSFGRIQGAEDDSVAECFFGWPDSDVKEEGWPSIEGSEDTGYYFV